MTTLAPSPLLAFGLRLDAVVSAATGVAQLLFFERLATWLVLPVPLLVGSGVFMLGYAALAAWMAQRDVLPHWSVWAMIGGNVLWAIDCLLLAFGGLLSPGTWGVAFLLVHAAAVLLFAELQFFGMRRSRLQAGRAALA